jgi:hypothetical protein
LGHPYVWKTPYIYGNHHLLLQDFLHQAYATASLGCGNRPFEDRFCDRAQLQRWLRANDTSLDRSEEVAEFEDSCWVESVRAVWCFWVFHRGFLRNQRIWEIRIRVGFCLGSMGGSRSQRIREDIFLGFCVGGWWVRGPNN